MNNEQSKIYLTIDQKRVEAKDGMTILQIAQANRIDIPTYCVVKDLTPTGACRVCLVSVTFPNGSQRLVTACDTLAIDGMRVRTDTEEVLNSRRQAAEMLLSISPDTPSLQRLAATYGISQPSYRTQSLQKGCIQCGACVQACREKSAGVLQFRGNGENRVVTTANGSQASACDSCDICIKYCPTGAVTQSLGLGIGDHVKAKKAGRVSARSRSRLFFLSLFILLILMSGFGIQIQGFPNQLFSLMDPLQGSVVLVSGHPEAINYLPALAILILTILFGRFWCGWICPTGTVLQSFGPNGRRIKSQRLRNLKQIFFVLILLLAAMGSLAFFWTNPIALLTRPFAALFAYSGEKDFASFDWIGIVVLFVPFLIALALNGIEKGFWCRYLCPLGGMLGLFSKFSPFQRKVERESCIECGICAQNCPVGAINPTDGFSSDPAECIQCTECAARCPKYVIRFHGEKIFKSHEFDPDRRELLGIGGAAAAAAAIFAGMSSVNSQPATAETLLPPGAVRDAANDGIKPFLSLCTRCGQCIAACPQKIIKPSLGKGDWTAALTPIVDLSANFCRPDCNRCGQVCPSGAIPQFTVTQKQQAKIGVARVDPSQCIRCYRCVSACPYQAFEQMADLQTGQIFPHVETEKCNGCGLCLTVCPAREAGAIKIFPLQKG